MILLWVKCFRNTTPKTEKENANTDFPPQYQWSLICINSINNVLSIASSFTESSSENRYYPSILDCSWGILRMPYIYVYLFPDSYLPLPIFLIYPIDLHKSQFLLSYIRVLVWKKVFYSSEIIRLLILLSIALYYILLTKWNILWFHSHTTAEVTVGLWWGV